MFSGITKAGNTDKVFSSWGQPLHHGEADLKQSQTFPCLVEHDEHSTCQILLVLNKFH